MISPEPRPDPEENTTENSRDDDQIEEPDVEPPSVEEQKTLIKQFESSQPEYGEKWYLICSKWFKNWKAYVKYDGQEDSDEPVDKPPQIDNTTFIDDVGGIAEGKRVEGEYFDIIPEEAWQLLHKWYKGGPVVSRSVSQRGASSFVQLYPLYLKLTDSKNLGHFSNWFNPTDTLERMFKEGCRKLNLDASSTQMYIVQDRAKHYLVDMDNYLEEHVKHKETIFFAPKTEQPRKFGGMGYSGWYSSTTSPGLVGLNNLGNTCFMNSALQCLSHTMCLTNYFKSGLYRLEINSSNPLGTGGHLVDAYAALLLDLWGTASPIAPREFKSRLERFAPQFSGYQQHDSQELLAFLLDGLHEDLNRIIKKPYVEVEEAEGRPDAVVAQAAWNKHKQRNDSIIVDWFQGQLKSTLVCPEENCKRESVTFDPFMYLSLPLPVNNNRTVNVKVYFKDPKKEPMEVVVATNKFSGMPEFRKDISSLCGVPANCLVVADVFNARIFKIFTDSHSVDNIQTNDIIYVYEVEPPTVTLGPQSKVDDEKEDSEPTYVPIRIVHLRDERTRSLFADPMVISVPSPVNYQHLCKLVLHHVQSMFKDPEVAVNQLKLIQEFETQEQQNQEQKQNEQQTQQDEVQQMDTDTTSNSTTEDQMDVSDQKRDDDSQVPQSAGSDEDSTTTVSNDPATDQDSQDEEQEKVKTDRLAEVYTKYFSVKPVDQYGSVYMWNREPRVFDMDEQISFSGLHETIGVCWTAEGLQEVRDNFEKPKNAGSVGERKEESVTLDECLNLFTQVEKLGPEDPWYCNKCKEFRQATKKFDLWSLPKILVIHLKRFSYRNKYYREKLETFVDFPYEGLDFSKYILSNPEKPQIYDLFAIDNHYGALGGGHYTAYCAQDGKWFKFDDSHVSEIPRNSTHTSAAYLLFYKRRESPEEIQQEQDWLRQRLSHLQSAQEPKPASEEDEEDEEVEDNAQDEKKEEPKDETENQSVNTPAADDAMSDSSTHQSTTSTTAVSGESESEMKD